MLLFMLQSLVILVATSTCAWLCRKMRQPAVVGEITGGLLLGPLVFGHIAQHLQASVFPPQSLSWIETLSRVGLVAFLLLIGAELDLSTLRQRRTSVISITAGSVLLPFLSGLLVSPFLWQRFAARGGFVVFALFVGTATSITALPVLASILRDLKQNGRPLPAKVSSIALLCASLNDVLAWCVLAVILSLLHRDDHGVGLLWRLTALLLYLAVTLIGVRRLLRVLSAYSATCCLIAAVLFAWASAQITDLLGLHLFFGAFLAGVCVPRSGSGHLVKQLHRVLRPITRFTMPLFFALTGLRLQRDLFQFNGWVSLLLIFAIAIIGKVVGAAGAARWVGFSWSEAGQMGVLLNTRGLVELIVLTVGYREGVLNPNLFTLFVLMALGTTAVTAPVLGIIERSKMSERCST